MKKTNSGRISSQQEKELLIKAKKAQGTLKKKLERQIINANINLVKYMITRYFSYTKLDYDELLSEGVRSLPKAIEKFDINSNNRFAVYAGCWIIQYIRSYIEKTKLIKNSASANGTKEIVFYDDSNYSKNDEKNSYYMLDAVSESSETTEIGRESSRQYDIAKHTNNLLNSLESRDTILFIRLFYKVAPHTCLDVYRITTEEEGNLLIKELKVGKINSLEKNKDFLSDLLAEEKKKKSSIVSKYLQLFIPIKSYKIGEIAKIIGKSENYLRKIKQTCLSKLQELAKEKEINPSLFQF